MRLSVKLLIIGELVLIVLTVVMLFPVRQMMRRQVVEDMQRELNSIAGTAALMIDGDLFEQVRRPEDADTEAFARLRAQLDQIRETNYLEADNIIAYYFDGEVLRHAVMTHEQPFVGREAAMPRHIRHTLSTGDTVATELQERDAGRWLASSAPIRNGEGQIVGVLEINRRSDAYFERFDAFTIITTVLAICSLAVCSLLGWFVLDRLIIQPMRQIHAGLHALGRQEFTHRVDLATGDEFQQLGDTMNELFRSFNIARAVQQSFFPEVLPQPEGYRIAAATEPCDATGGDYFDAIEQPDGRTLVLVADVSGHGLGPSLLMASCRAALHALAATCEQPNEMVEQVERLLARDLQHGRFVTMILGVLEPDGRFTYANAGHGPAIAVTGGEVRTLGSHRPPVGVPIGLDDQPMQTTIQLAAGDRVLLASDGVNEAQNPEGQQFGHDRLAAIAADTQRDCDRVVRDLREAVEAHRRGRPADDDVTIVCVDRC